MSMKIYFDDDYTETTYYNGVVDDKYKFTVNVDYNSALGTYVVEEIIWPEEEPPKRDKAVKRIMDIVYKWHPKGADMYAKDY